MIEESGIRCKSEDPLGGDCLSQGVVMKYGAEKPGIVGGDPWKEDLHSLDSEAECLQGKLPPSLYVPLIYIA